MIVRRARQEDLASVNGLLAGYGMDTIDPEYINSQDISLVAEDKGNVVGFIFVGRFAKGTIGYVDCFVVSPEYHGKKVGEKLARKALKVCLAKGVKLGFAHIAQDEYMDNVGMNALKNAMGTDGLTYMLIKGRSEHIKQELKL